MIKIDYEIFDAKVDKFLRHQMSEEEQTSFKEELKTSPELMSRARTMALMVKQMKAVQEEEDQTVIDKIKGINVSEFRRAAGLPPKVINMWPRIIKYAVAVCVVGVICTLGFKFHISSQYTNLGNTSDFYAYTTEFSESANLRGALDECLLSELGLLYDNVVDNKDLSNTIIELEKYYEAAQHEDFEVSMYIDDIAWTLAFAYLKNGNGKKAISILEEMLERNKDYPSIAKSVQELLDKIQEI